MSSPNSCKEGDVRGAFRFEGGRLRRPWPLQDKKAGLVGEEPRPETGRGCRSDFLLAVLARPRPKQGVAFATFVVEQVGVDRRVEGRVVELQREVVATLLGALRPGGADLSLMWCTT